MVGIRLNLKWYMLVSHALLLSVNSSSWDSHSWEVYTFLRPFPRDCEGFLEPASEVLVPVVVILNAGHCTCTKSGWLFSRNETRHFTTVSSGICL